MTLTRALFLVLAILVPASWTVARAGDDMKDSKGDMKGKKMKKKDKGDMDSDKGDMKKGDMDKK